MKDMMNVSVERRLSPEGCAACSGGARAEYHVYAVEKHKMSITLCASCLLELARELAPLLDVRPRSQEEQIAEALHKRERGRFSLIDCQPTLADHGMLLCPVCESENVHLSAVRSFAERETFKAGEPRYRDANSVELEFWCESSCRFSLLLGTHKGSTFFSAHAPQCSWVELRAEA